MMAVMIKMASTETSALAFRNDLMTLVKDIVWKDAFTAMRYEDPQYSIEVDEYTTAASSLMEHFSTRQLVNMLNYDDIRFKNIVESIDRKYQRPLWILRNYHEHNDYYRMLAGLPPENPTVFGERANLPYFGYAISLDSLNLSISQRLQFKQSTNYGETVEYIHQLTPDQCAYLEIDKDGINRESLIASDKNYRYLNHLTNKKIYPFVARLADRFSLLYSPATTLSALGDTFQTQYEASRIYMIQRYYTEAYKNRYEFYEGFIGLAILFMTIQQLNVARFGYLTTHKLMLPYLILMEMFDMDSIKIVYAAYSVPFYPSISSNYHLKIVKLINRLLSYKGSNHVFFDLAALFDYDKLSIYQYYLMKRQKLNEDGSPHFEYDYTYDYNGRIVDAEINYPASYEFSFVKRTIGQESAFDAVNDANNYVDYDEVIHADEYWLDDGDLRDKMYKSEYNYIETKYIGMQMQLSVSEFFYENIYFIRMIMDNRDTFQSYKISYNKMGIDIDLFTLVIYLHALIVKKLGWTGEFILHPAKVADKDSPTGFRSIYHGLYSGIPTEATKIAKIRGFNFKDDLQVIANEIMISSQRNTVKITYMDTDNIEKGWYLYPMANSNTRNNANTGINNKSLWENMDVEVYSMENGELIEKLGVAKGLDCHGIVGGIGTSVTRDTININGETIIGKDVERSNLQKVVYTCMHDVVFVKENAEQRPSIINRVLSNCNIEIANSSINLFTGNDNLEMHTLIDMILSQRDIANANIVNSAIASTMGNIKEIKKFITNKMISTKDHKVYMAYKHLYQVLMTIDVLPEVIEKRNTPNYDLKHPVYKVDEYGNVIYASNGDPIIDHYPIIDGPNLAVSFEDLLEDINTPMELHLMGLSTEEAINDEIDYCLILMQNLCTDIKYLNAYGTYNIEVIIEYMYKLIQFFKSVKVQLINFKVIYLLDSEVDNMLKLMDDLAKTIRSNELDEETFAFSMIDTIEKAYKMNVIDENIFPKDILIQYLAITILRDVVLTDKDPPRTTLARIWAAIDLFDEYKHLHTIRLIVEGFHTLSKMLEDIIYQPNTTKRLELTINYNDSIYRIMKVLIQETPIWFSDEINYAIAFRIMDDIVKFTSRIPYFEKHVSPGHPSQVFRFGYFLYDDRKGNKQIVNEHGEGILGSLKIEADVFEQIYIGSLSEVNITTEAFITDDIEDTGDNVTIPVMDDSAILGSIGIWSTSVPEAIRFVHDMDLGGTWGVLNMYADIISSTSTDKPVPCNLVLKDTLIVESHKEFSQFGFNIPIDGYDGILTASFINDEGEDEERVLSGEYKD